EGGAERGFAPALWEVPVFREPLELVLRLVRGALDQALTEIELPCHLRTAGPRDDVGAHLGELPLGEVGMRVVQRVRTRQLEHAVAEELEPLVRRAALARPRRVREHGLRQLRRERVDQLDEATGAK